MVGTYTVVPVTGNKRRQATPEGAAHKARRESLGIPKEALHEASGVDRGTQLAFETGKRPVSPPTIRKLTKALDRLEREALAAEAQEPATHLGDVIGTTQAGEPIVEYTVELPDGTTVKASVKGEVDFGEFAARVAELVARIKP